jgi:leader peptidase (prepilin peptidase)/N-methyltransferase
MTIDNWLWTTFWFAMGTALGSFFVVVGMRLPNRKSIVSPPSACPHCGNQIKGIDLVPVVGWIWRRAKCRHCESPISAVYPLIELFTGLCFAFLFADRSSIFEWIAGSALVSILIVLCVSDLQYRLLPNRIVYPSIVLFAVYRVFVHPLPLWEYALGFVVGGGMLWIVSWVSIRMNRPAMGGGDIKLMAALGLLLGAEQTLFIVLLSSLLGLLSGIALIAAKRMSRQTFLPFGPFIAGAALISWVYGDSIVSWYLTLFAVA